MKNRDIRWTQRFQNFEKSFLCLENAIKIELPDITQKAGLIQFFEMSFELSWNTIKDYLENQGFANVKTPREVLKKAFEIGLIIDGHSWLTMLEDRNLSSHTYDQETARVMDKLIREKYYPLLNMLYGTLKQKKDE